MKTITTLFISIIALVATTNANSNITINSTAVATTSLNGTSNSNTVVLNWSANNIAANSRFEIERSFYSNNFSTITTMPIAFSNSNFRMNDNAAELSGRKIAYYRVKLVDANGTVTYSNTMVVNLNGSTEAIANNSTVINFTAAQNGNAVIKVVSATGKTVSVKNMIAGRGNNTATLENMNSIAKGIYTAVITVNGVVINTQKVIAE